MAELQHWEQDKTLYVFTSLTAGSSHIVTATSRIETILRNARIPFTYIDTATNESAKKLFQRRARGKKLPLLVKEGFVIADLDEVEEYNEFGELEEVIGEVSTGETSITSAPAKMELAREGGNASSPTPVATQATSATASAPKVQEEVKKENKPAQQSSVMGQLAQEAAAKAKQVGKKIPAPLASKTNTPASPTKDKSSEEEKETPLSPSGVPLPNSPALKSPTTTTTIDSALKSPSPTAKSPTPTSPRISHHRHSSTGSAHSFIPEKSEPEVREHRGSELSAASQEEIRRIESECSIQEEDEEEELDEEAEDAILFGDAEEDEDTKSTPTKTVGRRTSVSMEPVLTPVTEEKPGVGEDVGGAKPLNIKGSAAKPAAVQKSAGVAQKTPDDAVEDEEDDDDSDEDEDEDSGDEDVEDQPSTSPAKDALPSSKTAPAGTTPASSSTKPADAKLVDAVEKVKIKDQEAGEGKQASVSVED